MRTMRLQASVLFCGAVIMMSACGRDSSGSKTDSATVSDSASAANAAGTLEGPSIDSARIDSANLPIGSTEGTIGETRKSRQPIDRTNAPRDSVIPGPYKTIDSLGRIRKEANR